MKPAHVKNDKETNSNTVLEFVSYYQTEVSHNIATIRELIEKARKNDKDIQTFQEIKNTIYSISDLAMVYGYEGVEAIGYRMIQAIDDNNNVEDLFLLLDDATKAIEEAMFLIDEKKERELIRDLSMGRINSDEESEVIQKDENNQEDNEIPDFDIREDNKLISMVSDADGQAFEMNRPELENLENDSIEIEFNSILSDDSSSLNFDIPKSTLDEKKSEIVDAIEDDILEIDFGNSKIDQTEENGIFQKIGQILGFKNKSRISYQD